MKILKKCGLILALFLMVFVVSVSAATIDEKSLVLDYDNSKIQFSAVLEYEGDGSVYITYKTSDMQEYALDSVYQIKTAEGKSITFDKKVNHLDCYLAVYVCGSDSREAVASYELYFPSSEEYSKAVESFESAEEIKDLFAVDNGELKNEDILTLLFPESIDTFKKIPGKQELICQELYNELSKSDAYKSDFTIVQKSFNLLCAINSVPGADADTVKDIITNTRGVDIKTQTDMYKVYEYTCFTDEFLNDVYTRMALADSFKNTEELYAKFDESVVLSAIKNLQVGAALQVTPILKNAAAYLTDIDFAGYEALGDKKTNVDKLMANNTFESLSALVSAYNKAVKTASNTSSSSPSGGGGGGGGGGGVTANRPNNKYLYADNDKETSNNNLLPAEPQKELFNDIADAEWAREAIEFLADKNIISGYPDGSYKPLGSVTRAEFIKILIGALNIELTESSQISFSDVKETDWYYAYVCTAAEKGIASGDGTGAFLPDAPISRGEIIVMIYRGLNAVGFDEFVSIEADFTDAAEIPEWALEATGAMCGLKIVNGFEDGSIRPFDNANRAEAAVMIYRLMNVIGN